MATILAVDTSTEACSVTLARDSVLSHCYELVPRQHNQRIFAQLDEVLPAGPLKEAAVDVLAYTHGPGSFTGLRIAASAVQGLAYSSDLPVVGVSTLACMAQGAWRRGELAQDQLAIVLLDARINELYWGLYEYRQGLATALCEDAVSAPADMPADLFAAMNIEPQTPDAQVVALGNGLKYIDELPASLAGKLSHLDTDIWPDSQDIIPLAQAEYAQSRTHSAVDVHPVYLRNEINWKKVHEQGR